MVMIRKRKKSQEKSFFDEVISWEDCLAKTWESTKAGRSVSDHCQIVGKIAEKIVMSFPEKIRTDVFDESICLLAACHDVGKITPIFQEKIKNAINKNPKSNYEELEQNYQFHGGATYLTLKEMGIDEKISNALGSHHNCIEDKIHEHSALDEILGGEGWQKEREEFIKFLSNQFQSDFPKKIDETEAKMLEGFIKQSDWIGSGEIFDDPSKDWAPLITNAVKDKGYQKALIKPGLSFESIFGFSPRDSQKTFIDAVTGPGVYVLEAPMGIGKTEAALFAAYKMLEQEDACGIYFALPTCLTSEKIYERVKDFLKKITEKESSDAFLITGQARFESGGEFNVGGSWFSQYHNRILARFGVGTIDQALIAAMRNRRSSVALSGLTGKVVIFDEVHSYNIYTFGFLEKLVQLLRGLHCTVIILSATLNLQSRKSLIFSKNQDEKKLNQNYPLVTASQSDESIQEYPVQIKESESSEVSILLKKSNTECIDEAINKARRGEQVLWIENTVGDAQEIYKILRARVVGTDFEVGLIHSRFLPTHRTDLESKWVSLYGKNGWENRAQTGRILIGTQVLEQSLDIDADFLVTRLSPIDLILQRLGRLWRHKDTPRPSEAKREAWILVPEVDEKGEVTDESFKGTFYIYSPYILIRSLEVLKSINEKIVLPTQIRETIEATYQDRNETTLLQLQREWKKEIKDLKDLATKDLSIIGHRGARLRQNSLKILILKQVNIINNGEISLITMQGREIKLFQKEKTSANRIEKAALLEKEMCRTVVGYSKYKKETSQSILKKYCFDKYIYTNPDEGENLWIVTVDDEGLVRSLGEDDPDREYCYRFGIIGDFGLLRMK